MKAIKILITFYLASHANMVLSASCMVLGDKSAKVISEQVEKSPPFLSASCESLKLVSGKAMATWVSKDGKPNMEPITASGVGSYPNKGAEERSSKVIWAEVTTTRSAQRAAYMRVLTSGKPSTIYIPAGGLPVFSPEKGTLKIKSSSDANATEIFSTALSQGETVVVGREALRPGASPILVWIFEDKQLEIPLLVTNDEVTNMIDKHLVEIRNSIEDTEQQNMLSAMLFEQMKLQSNIRLALSGGKEAITPPASQEPVSK